MLWKLAMNHKYKKLKSFNVLYSNGVESVASPYLVLETGLNYIELVVHRTPVINNKPDLSHWVVSEYSTGLLIQSGYGLWGYQTVHTRDAIVPYAILEAKGRKDDILAKIASRDVINSTH